MSADAVTRLAIVGDLTAMKSNDFNDYISELLSVFGIVRCRAMFGGYGIYVDGLFVAIIVDDTLYFKTNEETRPYFLKEKSRPFAYHLKGKRVSMSYYEVPPEAIDSAESIEPWFRLAMEAAKASAKKRSR